MIYQLASLLSLKTQMQDTMGQLQQEVALLMMHLGWTEDKVMNLPSYRRRMYVRELCELYGSYDEALKAVIADKNEAQWRVIEGIERYEKYVTDDSAEPLM